MTLADHLSAAHHFSIHGGTDPAPLCAQEIGRGEIQVKKAQLQAIASRSHVARIGVAFLERVLALMK